MKQLLAGHSRSFVIFSYILDIPMSNLVFCSVSFNYFFSLPHLANYSSIWPIFLSDLIDGFWGEGPI